MINIALVGNQNVGKTTIFNYLTGLNHHIGNFPGTTVTISKGTYLKNNQITIIDLPGIYSLTPFTQEEKIARDYLTSENIDYIINIIDATALFRCLFLTIQCLKLKIPMILAINKIELLKKHQGILNLEKLSSNLNVPCYPINALNGQGIDLCLQLLFTQQFNHSLKIDDIQQVLKDCYQSPIFHLSRFDHILLSKYLSYPLLFFFFLLVFILSFGIVGPFFNHLFSSFFEQAISIFSLLFVNHLHPILFSLIVNGIFRGCLSLLSFLPLILILFSLFHS